MRASNFAEAFNALELLHQVFWINTPPESRFESRTAADI
jgi:hypothetical protein